MNKQGKYSEGPLARQAFLVGIAALASASAVRAEVTAGHHLFAKDQSGSKFYIKDLDIPRDKIGRVKNTMIEDLSILSETGAAYIKFDFTIACDIRIFYYVQSELDENGVLLRSTTRPTEPTFVTPGSIIERLVKLSCSPAS